MSRYPNGDINASTVVPSYSFKRSLSDDDNMFLEY